MTKKNPLNDMLVRISSIRKNPNQSDARSFLHQILQNSPAMAVSKAATLIADLTCGKEFSEDDDEAPPAKPGELADPSWQEFFPDFLTAFNRSCDHPENYDKGANGKKALILALDRMEYDRPEPFLRGLTYSQIEANFDRAAYMRARCIAALIRLRYPERWTLLVDQLWDNWEEARLGAVWAATYEGSENAALVLRAKAIAGDKGLDLPGDPLDGGERVLGAIFSALVAMRGDRDTPFVARFLNDSAQTPFVRYQAAMALGESRLPSALALLVESWRTARENERLEVRERAAYGVAMQATDAALEVLRGWLRNGDALERQMLMDTAVELYGRDSRRYQSLLAY